MAAVMLRPGITLCDGEGAAFGVGRPGASAGITVLDKACLPPEVQFPNC